MCQVDTAGGGYDSRCPTLLEGPDTGCINTGKKPEKSECAVGEKSGEILVSQSGSDNIVEPQTKVSNKAFRADVGGEWRVLVEGVV